MKNYALHFISQVLTWVCVVGLAQVARTQTIIFSATPDPPGPYFLYQIDLATCTVCPILETPLPGGATESLVLPNGNVVVSYGNLGTFIYDLPSSTPIVTFPAQVWAGAIIHPNGTIYVVTENGTQLATFNPVTNTLTIIGAFIPGLIIDQLFWVGNTLYGFGYQGPGTRPVYEINLTNPAASVQIYSFTYGVSSATTTPGGQVITSWPGGGAIPQSDFNLYNLTTNSWTPFCQTPLQLVGAISSLPSGVAVPECVCLLPSAGMPTLGTANLCVPETYSSAANFDNNTVLFPEDGIGYILYSNPSDPVGSVLFQNSTGVFQFLPPMMPDVVYYIARVVGDVVNGQVLLSDPCLSVSPPIAVTWRPRPTLVSLASSNTDLCTGGCTTITANIAGTPPLFIYAQFFQNGVAVSPFIVSGASGGTASYTVCVPPGIPPGPVQYVICGLLDQFCSN